MQINTISPVHAQEQKELTKPKEVEKQILPRNYVLNNGLKVILLEDKAYPFISCFSWYKVGSRDDPDGMSGLTHLVEHLLFKNIGSFQGNQLASTIVRCGGEFSGFTSEDFTTFYANLPSNQIELAISSEAQRMREAHFSKVDVEKEIEHLVKEAQDEQQDLFEALNKEVHALAYERHPYHNPPGGWPQELEHLNYEHAKAHYDRYFQPNNAAIVLVGNFDQRKAMSLIEKYFSAFPKAENIPASVYPQERPQLAERQIKLKAHSGKESVIMAYKVSGIKNADAPVFAVLEQLFNNSLGQMHNKLAEQGVNTPVQAAFEIKRDPGLFVLNSTGIPANSSPKVIQILDTTIAQFKTKLLNEAEVKQAAKQAEFSFYCDGDGPYHAAFQTGFFETLANEKETYVWPELIRTVSAADILRVAKHYLNEENRVLGQVSVANANPSGEGNAKPTAINFFEKNRHLRMAAYQSAGVKTLSTALEPSNLSKNTITDNPVQTDHGRIWRKTLNNGLNIMVVESHLKPIVQICGAVKAGSAFEPADHRGMASLVTAILNSGSARSTKLQQVADQSDLGLPPQAMLKFECRPENIIFQTRCLNKDTSVQLKRLFNCLIEPKISALEFDGQKNDLITSLRQSESLVEKRLRRVLLSSLISPNCTYYPLHPEEEISAISDLNLADITEFYRENVNPSSTTLVICGDVDAKQIFSTIEQLAQNWINANSSSPISEIRKIRQPELIISERSNAKNSVLLPQSATSEVILGRIIPVSTQKQAENYWAAMLITDCALSSHPLFSRLSQQFNVKPELLDGTAEQAWTTKIFKLSDKLIWSMQINLLPKNTSAVPVAAIQNELMRFSKTGITPADLIEAKKYLLGNIFIKDCSNLESLARFIFRSFNELNEIEPMNKVETVINALNYEDINQFIALLFKPQSAAIVVAGPKDLIKQVHPMRTDDEDVISD